MVRPLRPSPNRYGWFDHPRPARGGRWLRANHLVFAYFLFFVLFIEFFFKEKRDLRFFLKFYKNIFIIEEALTNFDNL
jgi:hypothetical protein